MLVHLIQGFFCQDQEWVGLGMSRTGEGVVGIIERGLSQFLYSGIIYRNRDGRLVGSMYDRFGESTLHRVKITPDEVRFVKKYAHRKNPIHYKFRHEGYMYVGGYTGRTVSEGESRCIITEVPEDFFRPPE